MHKQQLSGYDGPAPLELSLDQFLKEKDHRECDNSLNGQKLTTTAVNNCSFNKKDHK